MPRFLLRARAYALLVATLLTTALLAPVLAPAAWAATVTYTYDALGRLIRAEYSTGKIIEYKYDASGNRTEVEIKN